MKHEPKAQEAKITPSYHLWLQPSGNAYGLFAEIIADLSAAYAGPFFEPHVTLLGSLPGTEEEIYLRTSQLGTSLQPFHLQLAEPAYGDEFFQCVFLKVQKTPDLMHAHELAKRWLIKESSPYMPHLSLLYGQYSLELKSRIVATIPEIWCTSFTVDKIHIIRAGSEHPKDWDPIQTISLSR